MSGCKMWRNSLFRKEMPLEYNISECSSSSSSHHSDGSDNEAMHIFDVSNSSSETDWPRNTVVTSQFNTTLLRNSRKSKNCNLSNSFRPLQIKFKKTAEYSETILNQKENEQNCSLQKEESSSRMKAKWRYIKNTFAPLQLKKTRVNKTAKHFAKYQPQSNLLTNTSKCQKIDISFTQTQNSHKSEIEVPCTADNPITTPSEREELDLFITLIESDLKKSAWKNKTNSVQSKKGGYLQNFFKSIESAKSDRKFLKHDKNYGFNGSVGTVINVESSFGVRIATIQFDCTSPNICAVIDDGFGDIRNGSKIESFITNCEPYTRNPTAEADTYIQPNKLLSINI